MKNIFFLLFLSVVISCSQQPKSIHQTESESKKNTPNVNLSGIQIGLDILLNEKIDLIKNKNIALVTNHSGVDSYGTPNYERLMNEKDVHIKIISLSSHNILNTTFMSKKHKI
mgnify:CR=1 FL=1